MDKEEIIKRYGNAQQCYWQLQTGDINYLYVNNFDVLVRESMEGFINTGFKGRFYEAWDYFFQFAITELISVFGNVSISVLGYELMGMWLNWYYGGHKQYEPLVFENALAKIHNEIKKNTVPEDVNQALLLKINEYYNSQQGYWTEYLHQLNPKRGKGINFMPTEMIASMFGRKAIEEIGYKSDYFKYGVVNYPIMEYELEDYIME